VNDWNAVMCRRISESVSGGNRKRRARRVRPTRTNQSLVTSATTYGLNGMRGQVTQGVRPSDAEVTQVTQSDAEVTQVLLEINGLRGLRRLASHANVFAARRRRGRGAIFGSRRTTTLPKNECRHGGRRSMEVERRKFFRLFPPFPPLTAFGGCFFILWEGVHNEGTKERSHETAHQR
jgi:hypothetical protein